MEKPLIINLTPQDIDAIFKNSDRGRWQKYIDVYTYLLIERSRAETLPDYERKFNYFYQIRRNVVWRKKFYTLFYEAHRGKHSKALGGKNSSEKIITIDFAYVLTRLFDETKNVEASFSSKMMALLDPDQPVIDRHVLSYIERRLPAPHRDARVRITDTITLHTEMTREFKKFLKSETGIYLVARFKEEFPSAAGISKMKMLDFVLWQSGGKKKIDQR